MPEAWLQDRIVDDPSILGLVDLDVLDVERRHPKAGRLDLLHFTKVLDEVVLGQDEEDSAYTPPADRAYWEKKGSKESVGIVDECLGILKANNPKLELKYNRFYIGLTEDGRPNNFVVFRAKKQFARAEVLLGDLLPWGQRLERPVWQSSLARRASAHPFPYLGHPAKNRELLHEIFEAAYQEHRLRRHHPHPLTPPVSGSAGTLQAVIGYIARVGLEHFGDFAPIQSGSIRLGRATIGARAPLLTSPTSSSSRSARYLEPSAYHFTPAGGASASPSLSRCSSDRADLMPLGMAVHEDDVRALHVAADKARDVERI